MAEEMFKLILAETPDNFRKWFLELFQNEERTKCSIEEFAVYFLNFVRNQTEEYNKNCSSSCNTPRKLIGHTAERAISAKQFSTSANNSIQLKSLGANNDVVYGGGGGGGGGSSSNKNISRDLFSSTYNSPNESNRSIKLRTSQKLVDQSQANDGFDSVKSPLYSDFTGDLKKTLTPIAVHRLNSPGIHAFSTPAKNISAFSTSTPSFSKQNLSSSQLQSHHYSNRSGNSHSRNTTMSYNSRQQSSNDSRYSFDDSSTCLDTSVGIKQSHEKSKDRRSANTSNICLGDFLAPFTSKQHSQKARKSLNSSERSPKTTTTTTTTPTAANVSHEKDFPSFMPKGKMNRTSLTPTSVSSVAQPLLATTATTTITTTPKSNQTVKPTKRVVPTRIGGSLNEFNCPAFRSDNNILELAHEENAESTHDLLKSQKDMIRRVFQEEQPPETNLRALLHEKLNMVGKKTAMGVTATKNAPPIDLQKITNKPMLDKFIDIYSIVLDLNLVTNVLTEVAYLVNLINLDVDEYYDRNPHMLDGNSINERTNAIESTLSKINAVGEATAKQNTIDTMVKQQQQQPMMPQQQEETGNAVDIGLNKVSSTCATTVNAVANSTVAIDSVHSAILLLKNINNCVYFGLGVLQLQKNILRMLDVTSIKVLLENERLTTLDATIKDDLTSVYSHKMQLERPLRTHDTSNSGDFVGGSNAALLAPNNSMKVFYQQEQDTQMNFPSAREAAAFKKQRDHFYSILGIWESKHLNPAWDFETELGRKVRSMLHEMDHPINMAHMAKLFTAQLILSCNFNEVIQSDLPNIDPGKLNKLQQRLVAPSHFSTNFQFPGNQIFFKDFIIAAEHQTNFIEQLKIVLTNELMEMNDSSFETLELSTIDENEPENRQEYIVKPETLSTLSVLAKFLGLIVARPFIYEFGVNTTVDNRQIELRNKIRTMIDIKEILKKSIINHKLIVTLPWIVQFISMLDSVSLRSDYYRDVFNIFYELYVMTAEFENNTMLSMRQTSVFIIRSCLGWLFDQPNVPNEYYSYRQNRKQLKAIMQSHPSLGSTELTAVEIFVPKDLSAFFSGKHQIFFKASDTQTNTITGTLEKFNIGQNVLANDLQLQMALETSRADKKLSDTRTFDPLLETVLQAACPFLADFRVSIMPKRNSKTVSRTGRYRHITPKICEAPPSINNALKTPPTVQQLLNEDDDAQSKLVEAFLHSQTLSVRRTVEFVQERVYSAVVKDFQVEILIPFKKSIIESVDKIQLKDSNAILNELYRIYSNGEKELLKKWQDFVTPAALQRVKITFDGLLPHETVDACKLTCINIAVQQALAKINEWRSKNLKGIEIFSKDIQADVEKVLKNTPLNLPQMKNTIHIDLTKRPPWQTFDELQCKLHQLSMYPAQINSDDVNKICWEIGKCITEHVLPDPMYKTIGDMSVQLVLLLIWNCHDVVTKQVIDQFISLWQSKQFAVFVRPPTTTTTTTTTTAGHSESQDSDTQANVTEDQSKKTKSFDPMYLFAMVLSPVCIFAQQYRPPVTFDKLALLITKLIKNGLMSVAFLNEQCMKLMHHQWNQATLKSIARTVQSIIDDCRNTISSNDNEAFFLELLANLISGLDDIAFEP
ncbi:protein disks lost [Sitodiplosis mosellana]|uniref:protein disks lost n=1 Tax=Sitodiplosis mosellana TaxID=263140 RepID=UPI0024450038|nr:protein disks lost [Sitodiplosis mosellana]